MVGSGCDAHTELDPDFPVHGSGRSVSAPTNSNLAPPPAKPKGATKPARERAAPRPLCPAAPRRLVPKRRISARCWSLHTPACALEPGSSGAPSQRPVLRETTSTHRRPVPAKALAPMEETEPGRESDESDEQSLNALAPMLVTEAGIATDRRAVQPRRAPLPMLVSEPGRTIDSSVVQR